MYYLDTSVLTAYYCPEPLSDKAEALIVTENMPAISWLTRLELISAVSRKIREGMAREDGQKIIRQFEQHLFKEKLYQLLEIEEHHYTMAAGWIAQFNTPLRTLDGLHLAASCTAHSTLLTADVKLAHAAEFFGIDVRLLSSTN
ncbi:MAG: type II toxin-antitoxin system VapC family toxin [Candidatus Electrothrix sp. GW3-4]|uniref:type II toxin-antitoxin system VapC family toxin n=1 Tax=Candidatus Electrothrix sp. GW3-4 TaxID=3126740 RepID=UPI0030CEBC83